MAAKKEEIESLFKLYDADGSGFLDMKELPTVLRALGFALTQAQCKEIMDKYDANKDGQLSLAELHRLCETETLPEPESEESLREAFAVFDADGSGFVTREELKAALTTCGEPMSDAEVDAMLKGYDDGDGQLNFKEFVAMMTGAPKPGAEEAPAAAASAPAADAAPAAEAAPAKAALEGDQKLVNESWAAVKDAFPLSEVAKIFYGELFTLAPALKDTLFAKVDMDTQGEKLMTTIDFACGFEPSLEGALIELGERHAGYGAVEAHYPVVGQALLTTLKKGLGDKFTAEVETAWTNVFGVIQSTMLKGHDTEKGKALAQEWAAKNAAPAEAA